LKAVANSATADIQTELGNLTNILSDVERAGAQAIADAILKGGEIDQLESDSKNAGESGDSETKEKQKSDKEKLEQRLAALGGRINPLDDRVYPIPGGQLGQTIDQLEDAQAQLVFKRQATPLEDEELEKKRQQELDQLERRVTLLTGKRQRMESEIRDITEELKAFDD
jgi:predicted RNase H-like nuclease (RuvC/YqgF family)